jgi:hypothetical protein
VSALPAFARGNPCPPDESLSYADWRKSLTDREARLLLEEFIAYSRMEMAHATWMHDYYTRNV